jgi:hypothetical protein
MFGTLQGIKIARKQVLYSIVGLVNENINILDDKLKPMDSNRMGLDHQYLALN